MTQTAISIQNISKCYKIGKEKDSSLRGTLSAVFKSARGKKDEFWALKDLSFDVKKGDIIGIIGKNGAGKSTLLKVLSQITKPTEGRIEINGRVASLLEVGTGFHPELTGRENIYLNGTILGMSRKEVKAKFDEIVDFSGVEKFLDTPVKHYSSGMYVRLAFAVAAHLEPEILIIDEVLAVGDAEFQKRCLGKMKDVAGEGRTVLFVSHNMGAVKGLCETTYHLESGKIKAFGNTSEIIKNYLESKDEQLKNTIHNTNFSITDIDFIDEKKEKRNSFFTGEGLTINLHYTNGEIKDKIRVAIDICNTEGTSLFRLINQNTVDNFELQSKSGMFSCEIPRLPLTEGTYKISLKIRSLNENEFIYFNEFAKDLTVSNAPFFDNRLIDPYAGKILVNQKWKLTST